MTLFRCDAKSHDITGLENSECDSMISSTKTLSTDAHWSDILAGL